MKRVAQLLVVALLLPAVQGTAQARVRVAVGSGRLAVTAGDDLLFLGEPAAVLGDWRSPWHSALAADAASLHFPAAAWKRVGSRWTTYVPAPGGAERTCRHLAKLGFPAEAGLAPGLTPGGPLVRWGPDGAQVQPDGKLSWTGLLDGRPYRGELSVIRGRDGLLLAVNDVDLEDYVRGTLPGEMSPAWPEAALQAQAVAIRSYALAMAGRHKAEGYDLCSGPHCHIYLGQLAEHPRTDAAVMRTAHEYLTHGGRPIEAAYSLNHGGSAAGPREVWGREVPYLTPASAGHEPPWVWARLLGPAEFLAALRAGAVPVEGELLRVTVAARSESRRALKVLVETTAGSALVNGAAVRAALDLPSSLYSVQVYRRRLCFVPGLPSETLDTWQAGDWVTGAAWPQWWPGGPWISRRADVVLISGHGSGHGVGLSQHGAKALAEEGMGYRSILSHYYPGSSLERR